MSYAIRKDGQGWRAVNGPGDVGQDETYSDSVPVRPLNAADFESALDAHLDAVARQYRWDNRFTFVARAAYPNAWQAQAVSFGEWMDGCNLQGYQLLEAVSAGKQSAPASIDAFLATLPEFVPPV